MAPRVRVAVAGLGHWGKNLVRNFDDLADLRALCDADPETRKEFSRRYPTAEVTADFGELLASPDVEAIVIATPVPTHYRSRSRPWRQASTSSSRSLRRSAVTRWKNWCRSQRSAS